MAQVNLCDICNKPIDTVLLNDGFRVQSRKLFGSGYGNDIRYRKWITLDVCPTCQFLLISACKDKEFAKEMIKQWSKKEDQEELESLTNIYRDIGRP